VAVLKWGVNPTKLDIYAYPGFSLTISKDLTALTGVDFDQAVLKVADADGDVQSEIIVGDRFKDTLSDSYGQKIYIFDKSGTNIVRSKTLTFTSPTQTGYGLYYTDFAILNWNADNKPDIALLDKNNRIDIYYSLQDRADGAAYTAYNRDATIALPVQSGHEFSMIKAEYLTAYMSGPQSLVAFNAVGDGYGRRSVLYGLDHDYCYVAIYSAGSTATSKLSYFDLPGDYVCTDMDLLNWDDDATGTKELVILGRNHASWYNIENILYAYNINNLANSVSNEITLPLSGSSGVYTYVDIDNMDASDLFAAKWNALASSSAYLYSNFMTVGGSGDMKFYSTRNLGALGETIVNNVWSMYGETSIGSGYLDGGGYDIAPIEWTGMTAPKIA